MTNEDAIRILLNSNEYHHARGDLPHSAASIEAFNKAIDALKAESQTVNQTKALKEIIKYMKDDTVTYRDITDDIIIQILKDNGLWEDTRVIEPSEDKK